MRQIQLSAALGLFLVAPLAVAQDILSVTDLSAENAVVWDTAEPEIIDTRLVHPQIQVSAPWTGQVNFVKDHLPIHWRDKTLPPGLPNNLPLGGLLDTPTASQGPLFPGIQQTPWSPPDPTIAVGPSHIVETVNMAISFYSKSGTLQFSQNLDDTGSPGFFEPLGAGNFTFDPKCFYDHIGGRFVVVALEKYGTTQSFIDIAVSDDSDPNGIWYKYRTNSVVTIGANLYWVDYPGVGCDGQAYYVTGNLFPLSGGSFGGVLFRTFDRIPLLSGAPAVFSNIRDGGAASVQCSQHYGSNQAGFFVSKNTTTSLRIHAITNPVTAPALVSASVSVPAYSNPAGAAPNSGGGTLDTIDGRINNANWRDGKLYASHGISVAGRNVARWYQMSTNNWPNSGSVTLAMSGNIDGGAGVHTWFPAIFSNEKGDVGVAMAASSSTQFASIKYTGRKATHPAGTMGALKQMKIGTAGYSGRWGDYFGIAVDPENDRMFWVVGEYAQAGGWATWIGAFFVTPINGDLDCDGSVNLFDIEHFVQALTNPAAYTATHPNCDIIAGDVNEDGSINLFDIEAFVNLISG